MDPCSPAAFEARYQDDPDPWRFASAADEQDRYGAVLDLPSRSRYRSAFEPACSIGALTVRLAERCDQVLAVDVAPTAVSEAPGGRLRRGTDGGTPTGRGRGR